MMRRKQPTYARITPTPGGLAFTSTYDPVLVQRFKAEISAADKKAVWENGKFKHWIIAETAVPQLKTIVKQTLGVDLLGGNIATGTAVKPETRLIRVEYIGAPKDRGDGESFAFGAVALGGDLEWSTIFPEAVLKEWFEGEFSKLSESTLYSILNVRQSATQDEIKTAWRKQLKRFHPDVNRDRDAADMTRKINDAYEVLKTPQMRKRYNAGLFLEQSKSETVMNRKYWVPPVRCGNVLAEGVPQVGRFVVFKILEWQDIVENGCMLVTSWDSDLNSLVREWV